MSLTSYRAAPPRVNACEFGTAKPQAVRASLAPPNPQPWPSWRATKAKRATKANAASQTGERHVMQCGVHRKEAVVLGRPGNDLLSRVLRHSTIGAEEFNGRVRDGIGFLAPRSNHRTGEGQRQGRQRLHPELVTAPRSNSLSLPSRSSRHSGHES